MFKHLFAMSAVAVLVPAQAAISITSPVSVYGQTFDTLSSTGTANAWANDNTMPGWSLFNAGGGDITSYRASDGGSNTGAMYSFGSAGSGERALGSLGSNNASGWIALSVSNDTGGALTAFTLTYDGEQWRNGNASAQLMPVEYGYGSTFAGVATWTALGAGFDVTSPVIGGSAGAVNGNTAGLSSGLGGTVATNWASGSTLWVRWTEVNDAGSDHALAIDNVALTVTAVPEPGTVALFLAGLAAVGFVSRRRA